MKFIEWFKKFFNKEKIDVKKEMQEYLDEFNKDDEKILLHELEQCGTYLIEINNQKIFTKDYNFKGISYNIKSGKIIK
jgi:hypothetical protein